MKYMKNTFTCVTFPLPASSCPSSVIQIRWTGPWLCPLCLLHWWGSRHLECGVAFLCARALPFPLFYLKRWGASAQVKLWLGCWTTPGLQKWAPQFPRARTAPLLAYIVEEYYRRGRLVFLLRKEYVSSKTLLGCGYNCLATALVIYNVVCFFI